MSQQEVAQALEQHEHVAPKLTELVWLKLEEENAKFFQASCAPAALPLGTNMAMLTTCMSEMTF